MKRTIAGLVLAAAFSAVVAAPPAEKAGRRHWYSGSVISASLTAYGATPTETKRKPKNDVWWTYCVSGEGQTHSGVSRTNPSKAGLTVNSLIKFSTDKDRLYVLNNSGVRLTLRRLSLDSQSGCR